VFSLVVMMAQRLYPHIVPLAQSSWYCKKEATFSDVLAAFRGHLWASRNNPQSPEMGQMRLIPVTCGGKCSRYSPMPHEMAQVQL